MNLELLDPFGRQIPDRVDATLPLAPHLHFRQANHHLLLASSISPSASGLSRRNKKASENGDNKDDNNNARHTNSTNVNSIASNVIGTGLSETGTTISGITTKRDVPEWRAAYHVSYNRRGTYIAVGYGSGAVAVHSTSSRTLSALYRSGGGSGNASESAATGAATAVGAAAVAELIGNGVTTVSWSRRSRTLLAGAAGDVSVRVYDTTHPLGAEEAGLAIDDRGLDGDGDNNGEAGKKAKNQANPGTPLVHEINREYIPPAHSKVKTGPTLFADPEFDENKYVFVKRRLQLEAVNVPMGTKIPQHVVDSFVMPTVDTTTDGSEAARKDEDQNEPIDTPDDKDKRRKKKKKKKRQSLGGRGDGRLHKHPCISFPFHDQKSVGGSLQINPRCRTGGLAALVDGSLVLFWFDPATSWVTKGGGESSDKKDEEEEEGDELQKLAEQSVSNNDGKDTLSDPSSKRKKKHAAAKKYAIVVPLWSQTSKHFITCAAFDPQGERVYAATKDGTLLGFEVKLLFEALAVHSLHHQRDDSTNVCAAAQTNSNVVASPIKGGLPLVAPHFKLAIPGGASAWHLIMSRNGKYIVLNSSDGALRLYSTETCWTHNERKGITTSISRMALPGVEKPLWTFQDVVSKVKFVSCDLSGDGEYVVGGANGNDNRYELSIWNTSTGNLMDKLTGPAVQLYSVAWHPARASLAVATSDGLVDIWATKLNWTAFAPDFQALQKNVIYQEEDTTEEEEETKEQKSKDAMDVDSPQGMGLLANHQKSWEADDPTNILATRKEDDPGQANETMGDDKNDRKYKGNKEDAANGTVSSSKKRKKKKSAKEAKREMNGAVSATGDSDERKVDVLTIEPVPMFASDSEDESETFAFEIRVKNLFSSRAQNAKSSRGGGGVGGSRDDD